MLETCCYELDFKVAALTGNGNGLSEDQIKSMSATFKEIRKIDEDIENVEHTITLVHNAIAQNIAIAEHTVDHIHKVYEPRLIHLANLIKIKVRF